jgi:hypothetical protein
MNVEVGLAVAVHPMTDHHGLGEVHEVAEEANGVKATEAENEGKPTEIAGWELK